MSKKIISSIVLGILFISGVAFAQTNELPPAGITPGSPFYFLERAFEGIGTFFTFGNAAKAKRYIALAEERLAEAKVLAEKGDKKAHDAIKRYERQFEKATERAARAGDIDVTALVAEATTKHLFVLDEVIERVPEQAKEAVRKAKERSIAGQIGALKGLVQKDPERAVGIFSKAAEGRLKAAKARLERGRGDEDEAKEVEENFKEYEKYAKFGEEISTLASKIHTGEVTVEDLVEKAISHHLDVLKAIQDKLPVQAQEQFQRALDSARKVQKMRPSIPMSGKQEAQQQEDQKKKYGPPASVQQQIPADIQPEQDNSKGKEEKSSTQDDSQVPSMQQEMPSRGERP